MTNDITFTRPFRGLSANTNDLLFSFIVAIVLTGISYLVAVPLGWLPDGVNWLEAFAVFTSYSCTYLCVKQRRINYPIGALSTAAYSLLFFQQGLYASAILNAYLVPTLVYGWFRWRNDANTRPVSFVALKWYPVYIGVTVLVYLGASTLNNALGGSYAFWDTFILIGTVLAQLLLDNKKIENWIIWLIVDGVAIYVYFSSGLPVAGIQYVFFFANCVYGYVEWEKTRKAAKGLPTQPAMVSEV